MNVSDSRIYIGRLEDGRPAVYAVEAAAVERLRPADEALDWGAGAGDTAMELARTLLSDASGSEPPADVCRLFAEQVVRRVPRNGFVLQRDTVNAWLRRVVAV